MARPAIDVALASCLSLPEPDPDAAPLSRALAAAGLAAEVLAWDDPAADWSRARLVVLRSTWNYARDRERFLEWAERVSRASELWNPLDLVRWNTHKGYLLELEAQGVAIAPTLLLPRGSDTRLRTVMDGRSWAEVVVKPAVSAGSFRTRRFSRATLAAGEEHLRAVLSHGDALVQRYLPGVEEPGERALVWIEGELTHAVRKSPRFEGEQEAVSPHAVPVGPAEIALARRALGALTTPWLYARVDLVRGPAGTPVLMELELVEPSLFFAQSSPALHRFVRAIRARLDRS